jgi:hypothetical protein
MQCQNKDWKVINNPKNEKAIPVYEGLLSACGYILLSSGLL